MIREMTELDFKRFWPTFQYVIARQDTYAFDPNLNLDDAYQLWCVTTIKSFVFEDAGSIVGSYYIKANAMGPCGHICNCGFMVSAKSRGKGIAKQLCEHSQNVAVELGFHAMQFNSVVASNQVAISLWEKLGFHIIGTIPFAYNHATLGFVDSYIMHKQLKPFSS